MVPLLTFGIWDGEEFKAPSTDTESDFYFIVEGKNNFNLTEDYESRNVIG